MNENIAYQMGFDCELSGANEENCNFAIFSTPQNTKAWETGNKDAAKQSRRTCPICGRFVAKKNKSNYWCSNCNELWLKKETKIICIHKNQ